MTENDPTSELLAQEERFWKAMQEKDGAAAGAMTAEQSIVVGAQGVSTIDAKSMAKMTKEGPWQLESFTIDKAKAHVQFVRDDVALVGYPVTETIKVEGETLTFTANDASVWVRQDGKWLCAMHTESLAGDPFGRDRKR